MWENRVNDGILRGNYDPTLSIALEPIPDPMKIVIWGLGQRGRQDMISSARAVYCFLAVAKLRYPGVEVGRRLGICGPSVSRAARRGKELFQSKDDLQVWWAGP